MFDIYLAGGGREVFKCGRLSNLGTGALATAPSTRKQILASHHNHDDSSPNDDDSSPNDDEDDSSPTIIMMTRVPTMMTRVPTMMKMTRVPP